MKKPIALFLAAILFISLALGGFATAGAAHRDLWTLETYGGSLNDYTAVHFTRAEASSTLKDDRFTYKPEWAIQSNPKRAWVEGVKGPGKGESLKVYFDRETTIDLLCIHPGYQSVYEINNRPKEIELDFSDGSAARYVFEDRNEDVVIDLDGPTTTKWVKITIVSVYPGTTFDDTCITEVYAYADAWSQARNRGLKTEDLDSWLDEYTGSLKNYTAVRFTKASASSTLKDDRLTYKPEWAIQSNPKRAWVEGVKGPGSGESLTVSFDKATAIDLLCIHPGYEVVYQVNNRPREVALEFSDGTKAMFEFEDRNEEVVIDLGGPITAKWVKITILSVYPGSQFDDTCITEVYAFRSNHRAA